MLPPQTVLNDTTHYFRFSPYLSDVRFVMVHLMPYRSLPLVSIRKRDVCPHKDASMFPMMLRHASTSLQFAVLTDPERVCATVTRAPCVAFQFTAGCRHFID